MKTELEAPLADQDVYFFEALAWVYDGHWAAHDTLVNGTAIRVSPVNDRPELFDVLTGSTLLMDWTPTPEQISAEDWQIVRG
jgi:hypothetical protein